MINKQEKSKKLKKRKKGKIVPKEQVDKSKEAIEKFKEQLNKKRKEEALKLIKNKELEGKVNPKKIEEIIKKKGKEKTGKILEQAKEKGISVEAAKRNQEEIEKIKEEIEKELGPLGKEIERKAEMISSKEGKEFKMTPETGKKAFQQAIEEGLITSEEIIQRLKEKGIIEKVPEENKKQRNKTNQKKENK